jgi:(1->4)-alpha-D-glucan 1-alpha-D-glucosylmutase
VRVPLATYRVQVHRGFDLKAVRRIVPYIRGLGIDTVYLSPIVRSRRGSTHGYDVVDPNALDPDRGSPADLRSLVRTLRANRMGLLLDIVPNHMAASLENPWWKDVLTFGRSSPFARVFDIDWDAGASSNGRVVLPLLSRDVRSSFARAELAFEVTPNGLFLRCQAQPLPLSPRSVVRWLDAAQERSARDRPDTTGREGLAKWADRGRASLSGPRGRPATQAERWTHFERELVSSLRGSPSLQRRLGEVAEKVNRVRSGGPWASLRRDLLSDQAYRLVEWWKVREINYRRFFDISDLVGVRQEDPVVFRLTHRWILDRVRDGSVQGLRIDHIDGLADPGRYLRRLRSAVRSRRPSPKGGEAYTVVEKILAEHEELLPGWPVEGTTGYEGMDRLTGVFVDPAGQPGLDRLASEITGTSVGFPELAYRAKRMVIRELFPAELDRLVARALAALDTPEQDLRTARGPMADALSVLTAALGVYRTYLDPERPAAKVPPDLEGALDDAERRRELPKGSYERLHELMGRGAGRRALPGPRARARRAFVRGWQQWTGAVAAKGVEDTALYRYPRLVARNEVGADPGLFAISAEDFHRFQTARRARQPLALTATSTHDSKRGEDLRVRLAVLSELAGPWAEAVHRWHDRTEAARRVPGTTRSISGADELLVYQSVVGAGPGRVSQWAGFSERLGQYMIKAAREAKERTTWVHPDPPYEEALQRFVSRLLGPERDRTLQADLLDWIRRISYVGSFYSVGQTLLKITVPGVPDFYQGTALWDLTFVDPDNRRPIDFARRRALLLEAGRTRTGREGPRPPLEGHEGLPANFKLILIQRALELRRRHRGVFEAGVYVPLEEVRPNRLPVIAFLRRSGADHVLVAVGRGLGSLGASRERPPLGEFWQGRELRLPPGFPRSWSSQLGNAAYHVGGPDGASSICLTELFRDHPVALLYARAGR